EAKGFAANQAPEGAAKVKYEKDTKLPNPGRFTILREDHTISNLVRMQLLRDPNVTFSGYQHPHPPAHDITVRVQTNDASSPVEALANYLDDLSTEFDEIAQKFRRFTGNSKDSSAFS
ncbi:TPA: hypothetical protein N0F65_010419, partial [Lagenidium giganteum]